MGVCVCLYVMLQGRLLSFLDFDSFFFSRLEGILHDENDVMVTDLYRNLRLA